MTAADAWLSHHPAPHRERVMRYETMFGLLGGPIAWFAQLCAGYALSSWPCFPKNQPLSGTLAGFAWTWPAMLTVIAVAFLIALAALLVSWRTFQRTRTEFAGDHHHLIEVGSGRTRFLALWGMVLGGGFAVATLIGTVAIVVVPRCAH